MGNLKQMLLIPLFEGEGAVRKRVDEKNGYRSEYIYRWYKVKIRVRVCIENENVVREEDE